jgi:hypothetical protein
VISPSTVSGRLTLEAASGTKVFRVNALPLQVWQSRQWQA